MEIFEHTQSHWGVEAAVRQARGRATARTIDSLGTCLRAFVHSLSPVIGLRE